VGGSFQLFIIQSFEDIHVPQSFNSDHFSPLCSSRRRVYELFKKNFTMAASGAQLPILFFDTGE
jgi:hypothetical protein